MWKDILVGFVSDIFQAMILDKTERKRAEKLNKKLLEYISREFDEFADTSLDCSNFARIIELPSFVESIRNYFFAINAHEKKEVYLDSFIKYICNECPHVLTYEARRFVKKIETMYTQFLVTEIEQDRTANILFNLISFSHKQLLERILDSEDNLLKYLKSFDKKQVEFTEKDIVEYHRVCNLHYGKIHFSGISGVESRQAQDINQFYVENSFSFFSKQLIKESLHEYRFIDYVDDVPGRVELKDFFTYNNKIVLIGAAGLGKSTTLNYLFCNYEKIYQQNIIKIKIDLKEYAKAIAEEKRTILWCLSQEFLRKIAKQSMQIENIENMLVEHLCKGECLVIFDALDEIQLQSARSTVRDEISTFCNIYYLNRFIISTREVGYLKNQFDTTFLHIKINEFTNEQIKKYSYNWIKVNHGDINPNDMWTKFEKEVKRANCRELIRNPIVLVLALVIFDIEKNLPNKRVEFYKKCIDTFLVVREDRKGALPQDDNFKNILGDNSIVPRIAHYKFDKIDPNPYSANVKFTHEELKNAIMEAIEVPDKRNWFKASELFAQYLIDRTELIREIDDDVLDFTHKTFYEYFLATYFARELDAEEIIQLLDNWIGDSSYNELAKLIIQVIIEKNDIRQHRRVIEFLFNAINEKDYNENNDKITNMFLIIVELYGNNMLLAKYQQYYYECLVRNAKIIRDILYFSRTIEPNFKLKYDVSILAETYSCIVGKSEKKFYETIACFSIFGEDFGEEVSKHYENSIRYIQLSSLLSENSRLRREKLTKRKQEAKNYFLTFDSQVVIKAPIVYLKLLDTIIRADDYENISCMVNTAFGANQIFASCIRPISLYRLVQNCYNSAEVFIVTLITLVKCANHSTDYYLEYVLSHIFNSTSSILSDEFDEAKRWSIFNNAANIWNWLNGKVAFQEFLNTNNIYKEEYKEIYTQLFDYYNNDPERGKLNIEKCVEKVKGEISIGTADSL